MPRFDPLRQFDVLVKNVSAAAYDLPEIGGYTLAPDTEVNLCDEALPTGHYDDPAAAMRAILELPGTVLYQKRVAGELTYRTVPAPANHD